MLQGGRKKMKSENAQKSPSLTADFAKSRILTIKIQLKTANYFNLFLPEKSFGPVICKIDSKVYKLTATTGRTQQFHDKFCVVLKLGLHCANSVLKLKNREKTF